MKSFTKICKKYSLPWSVFVGIAGFPGRLSMPSVSKHVLTVVQRPDHIFQLEGAFTCEKGEVACSVPYCFSSLIQYITQGEVVFVTSRADAVRSYIH